MEQQYFSFDKNSAKKILFKTMLVRLSLRRCTPSLYSSVSHTPKYNFSTSTTLDTYYKLTQAFKEEQEKRKQRLNALKEVKVDPKERVAQEYYKNKKLEKKKLSAPNYASIAEQKPSSRITNLLFERVALTVDDIYSVIQEQFPGILKSKNHLRHILTLLRCKKRVKTIANPSGIRENHLYCLTFTHHKRMRDSKLKVPKLGRKVESLLQEAQELTGGEYLSGEQQEGNIFERSLNSAELFTQQQQQQQAKAE